MSGEQHPLPPLPPSTLPAALVARCRAALLTSYTRTLRAELEVHRTHLRIRAPQAPPLSGYATRMGADDLVLALDEITCVRPVGLITAIIELPRGAAIALVGPGVRSTLAALEGAVPFAPRRFRPLFVGFWLINNRTGRLEDARTLP